MKFEKKTTATILIAVFILSTLAVAIPVSAATTWYVDGLTPTGVGTVGDPFLTIQEGIDAASAGDTIEVLTGIYTENLVVNEDITLMTTAGATIQTGTGVGIDIDSGASGFTLSGFDIESSGGTTFLIQLANSPNNVEISDNVIDSTGAPTMGISVGAAGATGLTIIDNEFIADSGDGSIWGPNVVDVVVTVNTFTGGAYAIQFSGVTGTSAISGNTITDYDGSGGIVISNGAGTSGLTISDNEITGCSNGIYFVEYCAQGTAADMTTVTVTDNELFGNTIGIKVGDGAHVEADQFVIDHNDFLGSTTYGLQNQHTSQTVDATYNWWGDDTGPYHLDINPGGLGDDVSDNVDFIPWLSASALGMTSTVEPATYDLTLTIVGSGSVTIDGSPYSEGVHTITLDNSEPAPVYPIVADPDTYWKLEGWSEGLSGSTLIESITLNDDISVTATFVPQIVSIDLSTANINFGTVVAGDPSDIILVTVTNDGDLVVDVSMSLSVDTGTFYADYLNIDLQPMATWPTIDALALSASDTVDLQLFVSSGFVPSSSPYIGTLVFEATPTTP